MSIGKRIKFPVNFKEFIFIVIIIAGIIIVSRVLAVKIAHDIHDAGGMRHIIVETGREVKSIINDINKE